MWRISLIFPAAQWKSHIPSTPSRKVLECAEGGEQGMV